MAAQAVMDRQLVQVLQGEDGKVLVEQAALLGARVVQMAEARVG